MTTNATRPPFDYDAHYSRIVHAIHDDALSVTRNRTWERLTIAMDPHTGQTFIAMDTPAPAGWWTLPDGPYSITAGTDWAKWGRNLWLGLKTAPVFACLSWGA